MFNFVRDFTIRFNTNGFGLRSNAIKDLCPLILHQLVIGWIGKAYDLTNLIFETSNYSKHRLRIFFFFGELEFHVKYSSSNWIFSGTQVPRTWVLHMKLEFQNYYYYYYYYFQFTITWLSKNRVLNWNLIFKKLSFKTGIFP